MGKWDVDFDDYEERTGGYNGDEPKNGIYDGKLVALAEHTTSDDALVWIWEITEEPYAGWRGWQYTNMSSAKWKTQQFTKAISGGDEKPMRLDPADDVKDGGDSKTVKKALPVRIRIKQEPYEGEQRARIRTVLPNEDAAVKKGKKKGKSADADDPYGDDD